MLRSVSAVFCLLLLCQVIISCETVTPEQPLPAILKGRVLDKESGAPVQGALLRVTSPQPTVETMSDSQGNWQFELDVEQITTVSIRVSKDGYNDEQYELLAAPGQEVNAPVMRLESISSGGPGNGGNGGEQPSQSGYPHSITLHTISSNDIAVFGTGGVQQTTITFVVTDSIGRPVGNERSANVRFRLGGRPDGGETLSTLQSLTGPAGLASTTLESGTISGVVQVIAEFDNRQGQTIVSTPVSIVIRSGLPDDDHFSIASTRFNLPGYHRYGLTADITAYVGDRYGNPVEPGHAVYFTSDGGFIQGSAYTQAAANAGRATAQLTTAAPFPVHNQLGPGYATIKARTIDENNQTIEDWILVLFSGHPVIHTDVTEVNVPNGGSQTIEFRVTDQFGNPLSQGTQITAKIEGKNVIIDGDTSVSLDGDYLFGGNGVTEFSVTLRDDDDEDDTGNVARLVLEVSGPNGSSRLTIGGVTYKDSP